MTELETVLAKLGPVLAKLGPVLAKLDPDQRQSLVGAAAAAFEKLRAELADGTWDPLRP